MTDNSTNFSNSLQKLAISVLGSNECEQEVARLFVETGSTEQVFAIPYENLYTHSPIRRTTTNGKDSRKNGIHWFK